MTADDDRQEAARQEAVRQLADTMVALRNRDALSLHRLSDKTSLDRKVLRGLEAGSLNPSLKTLDRIAQAFGVSVAQLLGGPATAPNCFLGSSALVAMNVKRLRHENSWSTSDLESRIRMKAAYVSFIETGRGGCTLQTLTRLAAGFDVDIAALFAPPVKQQQEPRVARRRPTRIPKAALSPSPSIE